MNCTCRSGIDSIRGIASIRRGRALELVVEAVVAAAEGVLVRPVATVVLPVTDVGLEDTLVVVALEVSLLAPDGSTLLWLVALILTIRSAIAVPTLGHTDTAFGALKL